jgi:hypothetical protein
MILEILEKLNEVEVKPHGNELFDPEVAAKNGFVYVGTLSPRLQRLGTLIDEQKKLRLTELKAFENRKKEVRESQSLTAPQKIEIVSVEFPSRLMILAKLELTVALLMEIFDLEISSEPLKMEPKEGAVALVLKIFSGWEVAVKLVGEIKSPDEPSQDNSEETTPRSHVHTHGKNKTYHFGGKHGEA